MLLEKGAAEDEDEEARPVRESRQYHNPDFFEDFITTLQEEMEGGNDDDEDDDDSEETEANAVAVAFAVGAMESGQGDDAMVRTESPAPSGSPPRPGGRRRGAPREFSWAAPSPAMSSGARPSC